MPASTALAPPLYAYQAPDAHSTTPNAPPSTRPIALHGLRTQWRLEGLHALAVPAMRVFFALGKVLEDEEAPSEGAGGGLLTPELSSLYEGFEQMATGWPGGAPALMSDLARADPGTASRALQLLSDHPDKGIARPAALAYEKCEKAYLAQVRQAQSPARGKGGGRNKGKKRR